MPPDLSHLSDEQLLLVLARNIIELMRLHRMDCSEPQQLAVMAHIMSILLDRCEFDDADDRHSYADSPN